MLCLSAVVDHSFCSFYHVERQIIPCSPVSDVVHFCKACGDSGGWYYELSVVGKFNNSVARMDCFQI